MIQVGNKVEHPDLGVGKVLNVLGTMVLVDFFGEQLDVSEADLKVLEEYRAAVAANVTSYDAESLMFRHTFEAMNLGVVPPDPSQLVGLTIGGSKSEKDVHKWLECAPTDGVCKVIFGFYGAGKTHHLKFVRAVALKQGWVTAHLEFDPKSADPAKPHLVYRGLMNGLTFPKKEDGTRTEGFFGLVKEIRDNWNRIRDGQYFRESLWFQGALNVLQYSPHSEDEDYMAGVGWLGGQIRQVSAIRSLARYYGIPAMSIPIMPQIRETADIYVFHLVVLDEICKALGYRGLIIVLDEAEHVRGYNVKRKERANNFFDLLARAAHPPVQGDAPPIENDYDIPLPAYWQEGPHFGLFVGLTEGDTFADPAISLRDACVFLHNEDDCVFLSPPTPEEYRSWCESFFNACNLHLGERMRLLSNSDVRRAISTNLSVAFKAISVNERVTRIWIKLASLVPSILLCGKAITAEELINLVTEAAQKASGNELPWD